MKNLLSFGAVSAVALVLAAGAAMAFEPETKQPAKPAEAAKPADDHKDHKHDKKDEKKDAKKETKSTGAKVGESAPDFSGKDFDGKDWKLADMIKANDAVVIEWFNPGCPFIVQHHKDAPTFNNLYKEFNGKKVAFVAINSSAPGKEGHGKADNVKAKADWKMEYPILNDETGMIGKMYGAKRTPQVFIITKDGKVAYEGAIDNNQDKSKTGDKVVNYVSKALTEILAGKPVSEAKTESYGCSVKYAK